MAVRNPRVAERFELRQRLGSGAYGTVWAAWDAALGQTVAVKSLDRLDPQSILRFKREFRALKGIAHPNLVSLHELLHIDQAWYLVMEYVPGVDLAAWVWQTPDAAAQAGDRLVAWGDVHLDATEVSTGSRSVVTPPAGQLSIDSTPSAFRRSGSPRRITEPAVARLRHVLPQLVEGIAALHRAEFLHRDLKPANIRVTPDGDVRILDCGLVTHIGTDGARSTTFAGTPHYMAPEQAGTAQLTAASDWYSLGVILFELLTGVCPFEGDTGTVVSAKLQHDAPSPADLVSGLPADLVVLCEGLLRRNPTERPALDALRQSVGTGTARSLAEPRATAPLLGRGAELAQLEAAWQAVEAGRTGVVLVSGLSGLGKSSLAAHFFDRLAARNPDLVALQGACYEGERVPYKGIDSVVDELTSKVRSWPPEAIASMLPRDALELVQIFPVLAQLSAVRHLRRRADVLLTPEEVRSLAFEALRELFARLASQHRVAILVDDLQWADSDGIALLLELLRAPRPPALLLVLAFRSDEVARTPALARFIERLGDETHLERVRIELESLPPEVSREAALRYQDGHARWRNAPESEREARASVIARESGGNPFFIQELAQADETDVADLGGVLRRRIAGLPDPQRRVLELVAVAGQPLARHEVAATVEDVPVPTAIAALQVGRLVRVHADQQTLSPYHGRVRDAVLDGMEPAAQRDCHARLARAIEATGQGDPERLATHLAAAGEEAKAAAYAMQAGQLAEQAVAFRRAAELYRFVLAAAEREDIGIDVNQVRTRLAEVLDRAGACAEAGLLYRDLARATDVPEQRRELRLRAMEQLTRTSHYDDAIRVADEILVSHGVSPPRRGRIGTLVVLWLLLRLWLTGFGRTGRTDVPVAERQRAQAVARISYATSFTDLSRAAELSFRSTLLALQAGEPEAISVTASAVALSCAQRGLHGLAEQGRAAARDALGQTDRRHARDVYLLLLCCDLGLRLEVRQAAKAAAELRALWAEERSAPPQEQAALSWIEASCLMFSLDCRKSEDFLPVVQAAGERLGDLMLSANADLILHADFRLTRGDPAQAEAALQRALGLWGGARVVNAHAIGLWARVRVLLYQGRWEEALREVRSWRARIEASGVMRSPFMRVIVHSARATAMLAAVAAGAPDRRELIAEARRSLRRVVRLPNHGHQTLGHLLAGGAAFLEDRPQVARRSLERAGELAKSAGLDVIELAATWGLGQIDGGESGRTAQANVEADMAARGCLEPVRYLSCWLPIIS